MLIGYAWIGGLDEHRVLDPNDERPEAVRNANPRYIPLLDYTTLLNYCEHFMRACTSPLQGSTQRPSLEVVLKAELETRDWACRLLRDAHLEGRSLSLSAALSQSLRDCNGYWHFTTTQSRGEVNRSAKKAKSFDDSGSNQRTTNGKQTNRNRDNPYWDNSNWKQNDKGEWQYTKPLQKKGAKGTKGKGKGSNASPNTA